MQGVSSLVMWSGNCTWIGVNWRSLEWIDVHWRAFPNLKCPFRTLACHFVLWRAFSHLQIYLAISYSRILAFRLLIRRATSYFGGPFRALACHFIHWRSISYFCVSLYESGTFKYNIARHIIKWHAKVQNGPPEYEMARQNTKWTAKVRSGTPLYEMEHWNTI